ncbi:hypothetical protein NX801_16265 [Streptomyces sp. LP05-1]|uniref:Uncharacterized protein n=1 Tax=Streptomyces pyxinae TaxID=2970734 RepID=A0ABT2CIF0_9ACTN|nr:hypothetical protein [Streptomyces sp. LP05-1]MCS0637188.1 hypothetical protein [Streptomyces sp. LP05-1]
MSSAPWTIESICDALGSPTLAQRFLGEINRVPAHEILPVFARWERIAKNMRHADERSREIIEHTQRGEEPPGDWIDGTGRLTPGMNEGGARGAA